MSGVVGVGISKRERRREQDDHTIKYSDHHLLDDLEP